MCSFSSVLSLRTRPRYKEFPIIYLSHWKRCTWRRTKNSGLEKLAKLCEIQRWRDWNYTTVNNCQINKKFFVTPRHTVYRESYICCIYRRYLYNLWFMIYIFYYSIVLKWSKLSERHRRVCSYARIHRLKRVLQSIFLTFSSALSSHISMRYTLIINW